MALPVSRVDRHVSLPTGSHQLLLPFNRNIIRHPIVVIPRFAATTTMAVVTRKLKVIQLFPIIWNKKAINDMDLCRKRRIVTTIIRSSRATTEQLQIWACGMFAINLYLCGLPIVVDFAGTSHGAWNGEDLCASQHWNTPGWPPYRSLYGGIPIRALPTPSDKNTTAGNVPSSKSCWPAGMKVWCWPFPAERITVTVWRRSEQLFSQSVSVLFE